jgi:flagellar hook-associated protein 2
MGTVGISFGSPMGGTGFDVSSTVSQIVANLQNVETPWKTQLSNLQTQDTAISNLGSLLSNLSTDVQNFTTVDGVLSQMEGSSSDDNVVTLTSASSTAIAGTHTIVVNSLATTSSGYLTGTTSATDQFSGSISIAVGTGAVQTVTVNPNDDTLSGLASAINSADIGVTASLITDANGSRLSLVSGTSGSDGDLSVDVTSLTDTTSGAALGYTSPVSGANANLTVDGISVSSASNTVSDVIPGVTFQLLSTSPLTNGTAETVQVQVLNDTSSVSSAMDQFVSDYNSLVSAINTQEGNTSSGTPEPLFGSPTLSLLQQQILGAINTSSPSGYLDPIANASDTLTGSLTINTGSGSSTVINLSSLSSGDQNLAGLVSAINSANIGVTAGITTNSSGSSLSLTSQTGGEVSVTSSIQDGGTALAYNPVSDVNSFTQLGISVNNDGTISLDSATLSSELNSDYSGVVNFFQNVNSWGLDFSNTLNNLSTSNPVGTLALGLSSDSATESSLNADISKENLLISVQQISLTDELNSANEILQSIPSNVNDVNELYSAITGYQAPQLG